jgi:hypothetical protein
LKACFAARVEKIHGFEEVKESGIRGDLGANTIEKVF